MGLCFYKMKHQLIRRISSPQSWWPLLFLMSSRCHMWPLAQVDPDSWRDPEGHKQPHPCSLWKQGPWSRSPGPRGLDEASWFEDSLGSGSVWPWPCRLQARPFGAGLWLVLNHSQCLSTRKGTSKSSRPRRRIPSAVFIDNAQLPWRCQLPPAAASKFGGKTPRIRIRSAWSIHMWWQWVKEHPTGRIKYSKNSSCSLPSPSPL